MTDIRSDRPLARTTRTTAEELLAADLVRCAAGDISAMARVYDATSTRVFRLAVVTAGDADLAMDLACDAYLEVWRRSPSYDPASSSAMTWILVVAYRWALAVRAH
ncbi:MAG: sigma factor [Nocardioides sp.]